MSVNAQHHSGVGIEAKTSVRISIDYRIDAYATFKTALIDGSLFEQGRQAKHQGGIAALILSQFNLNGEGLHHTQFTVVAVAVVVQVGPRSDVPTEGQLGGQKLRGGCIVHSKPLPLVKSVDTDAASVVGCSRRIH